MRLYVLIACCDPLRIFLYNDGLIRMSTVEYKKPNSTNIKKTFMHLTNYSINKKNENYIFNSSVGDFSGHKRSVKQLYEILRKGGRDIS